MDVFYKKFFSEYTILIAIDVKGKILEANEKFFEITGRTKDETIGEIHSFFNASLEKISFEKLLSQISPESNFWNDEIGGYTKNQETYWLNAFLFPQNDKNREITKYFLLGTIITKSINNQKKQTELLQKLSKNVPGLIYQFQYFSDGRSCFPYVSEHIFDIYECHPDEVLHDASKAIGRIHPEDLERIIYSIKKSFLQLSLWEEEYRVILPTKGLRWLFGTSFPEKQPDGSVIWHGYLTDITERKTIEQHLQYQAYLIEKISDAIIVTDKDLKVTFWNKGAEVTYGWKSAEVVGQKLSKVVKTTFFGGETQASSFIKLIQNDIWEGRVIQTNKINDSLYILSVVKALKDKNGIIIGIIAINKDITASQRAEDKILEQNAKLKEIAWVQSHKVRSPLANILGLASIFNHQNPADMFNKEVLEKIVVSAQRLDDVIHEIVKRANEIE